ncbi:6661_t:CDS:2 [Paraglomus brasilianum]|uniref:Mitochondrial genome maintenance protein MGM101 n=1 Tax=Paraglomus brasilianum TaxID=144538 RepID=A0A9N9CX29_9GLOM|nr:6661_t:CDS:2 [Paraglomus brasilianum]
MAALVRNLRVRNSLAPLLRSVLGDGLPSTVTRSTYALHRLGYATTAVGNTEDKQEIELYPQKQPQTQSLVPPGFNTPAIPAEGEGNDVSDASKDWSKSFYGLSDEAFPKETRDILLAPLDHMDIECKPDGMIYLPEIKYRRVLNKAFGPGGWGLAPRGETSVGPRTISREYALVCLGRLVSLARGESEYFDPSGLATAAESTKSNALMRCCKDLGIASELWDPRFIREFKKNYCEEVFVEYIPHKKKKKIWKRRDNPIEYPYARV